MNPFLGEIRLVAFNFPPRGWAFCDGQILPIAQNQALFTLFGTLYGGDGRSTFALPDLRERNIVGEGAGPGLSAYAQGEKIGQETVAINAAELPAHGHGLRVSSGLATLPSPEGAFPAAATAAVGATYGSGGGTALANGAVTASGSGQAHTNRQPYLELKYMVALQGIFPSRQ